jgi:hypothetical protein
LRYCACIAKSHDAGLYHLKQSVYPVAPIPEVFIVNSCLYRTGQARHAATKTADTVKTRPVYKLGNVFIGLSKSAAGSCTFLYSKSDFGTIV